MGGLILKDRENKDVIGWLSDTWKEESNEKHIYGHFHKPTWNHQNLVVHILSPSPSYLMSLSHICLSSLSLSLL